MLSTRQQIENRSEKRGIKLGIRKKQEEMAERLLLKGMGIPFIEDTTGLPAQEIRTISDRLNHS